MKLPTDPAENLAALIRCPSVTPAEGGALTALEAMLKPLGFAVDRPTFSESGTPDIENLYARRSGNGPHLMFAGHTDVVPVGDEAAWTHPPFSAAIANGEMYGRGAVDMKGGIACFVAAVARHVEANGGPKGSVSLLITGDEEGPAINGTRKMLGWLKQRGETIDHCVVGEPTATARAGDTIKNGRRGSLSFEIVVRGTQGHVAYPQQGNNPIPALAALVSKLSGEPLDAGNSNFDPSTLAFTTVDVGNPTSNVTPAEARANFNIRFNDLHTPASLTKHVQDTVAAIAKQFACEIDVKPSLSGESFVTQPGAFTDIMAGAVEKVTGARPVLSTSGGTSDARFIKDHCPICEFGAINATAHKIDERIAVADIEKLVEIYAGVLDRYFAKA